MSTVQLYHGDCLDFMRTMPAGSVDAVVTDPPYGIYAHGGKWGRKEDLQWDRQTANIAPLLDFAPIVAFWGGNYFELPPSRGWLIWYKPDSTPSTADAEMAWTNQDQNTRLITHSIAATNGERVGHPTQKPLRVMTWCLDMLRIPTGATVFDPFMGSGTTGVACVRTGRNFIGCEIDAGYFAIAQRRIAEAQLQPPLIPHEAFPQPEQLTLDNLK
jgi:site-specific DNA-methyltransferase (adenine-specific)/modification methylase